MVSDGPRCEVGARGGYSDYGEYMRSCVCVCGYNVVVEIWKCGRQLLSGYYRGKSTRKCAMRVSPRGTSTSRVFKEVSGVIDPDRGGELPFGSSQSS